MHAHARACACVVYICVCKWVLHVSIYEGQKLKLVSLSIVLNLMFETRGLTKARFLEFRLHWLASEILGSTVFVRLCWVTGHGLPCLAFMWMSGILYVDVSFYTLSHLPSLPSYCFCKLAILHQGSTVRWSWFWVHSSCIHGSIVLQTWLVVRFVSIAPLLGSILLYHLFPPLCPPSCSQFSPILWPHFCSPALGRLFGLGSLVLEVCVNYASYRLEYMNTWPPVGGG